MTWLEWRELVSYMVTIVGIQEYLQGICAQEQKELKSRLTLRGGESNDRQ
jgi:hypothetical protein